MFLILLSFKILFFNLLFRRLPFVFNPHLQVRRNLDQAKTIIETLIKVFALLFGSSKFSSKFYVANGVGAFVTTITLHSFIVVLCRGKREKENLWRVRLSFKEFKWSIRYARLFCAIKLFVILKLPYFVWSLLYTAHKKPKWCWHLLWSIMWFAFLHLSYKINNNSH